VSERRDEWAHQKKEKEEEKKTTKSARGM